MSAAPELFISDPHGEYEEFSHIVRSACGAIRARIDAQFSDTLGASERAELATLVYYPQEKSRLLGDGGASHAEQLAWLYRSFAREAGREPREEADIVETCEAIQRLAVGRVHLTGDIYDRGPAPELIMDELATSDNVDIQWGNHDVVWMGAALGQRGCIAHVVRNCARYANLSVLEDAYGIDLTPLRDFATSAYGDDPCVGYALKGEHPELSPEELATTVKIQKAMAILQFKVEAQTIDEYPSFGLSDRKLLHTINRERGTVEVDGVEYAITDPVFPTVDWSDPYALSEDEEALMQQLVVAFTGCARLQRHMQVLIEKGSLYKICGDFLVFHACVPLNADGTLKEVTLFGQTCKGRALFDLVDSYVRAAFTAGDAAGRKRGADLLWYLWLGQGSPLFAKSKMATFEIYLVADKAARKEVKNPFYTLCEDERVVAGIFEEFGMDPSRSRIVCGHVPVKVKDGEDPVKCAGRGIDIDGGMSKPYQRNTGIAGFTLVSSERGLALYAHHPFAGRAAALMTDADLTSDVRVLE